VRRGSTLRHSLIARCSGRDRGRLEGRLAGFRLAAVSPLAATVGRRQLAVTRESTAVGHGTWPPELTADKVRRDPRWSIFQWSGKIRSWDAYLTVAFGRRRPTDNQLAGANAEIGSVALP